MSKKAKKKKGRRPNLSPLSTLRPRLDGLFGNPDWIARGGERRETADLAADLTEITKKIDPAQHLPIIITAYQSAPESVQAYLDEIVPFWLVETAQAEPLSQLIKDFTIDGVDREVALRWLASANVDISAEDLQRESSFYKAFLGKDDMGSQGIFFFFYYHTRGRERVKGFSLLLDFNPPWEGAAKDGMVMPQHRVRDAVSRFVYDTPYAAQISYEELDATEVKANLAQIFSCNTEQNIRLHKDIVTLRTVFEQHIMPLPDDPDGSTFTMEDFDSLTQLEQRAEDLMKFEQTVGRRVRLDDGKEIVVMGADDPDKLFD